MNNGDAAKLVFKQLGRGLLIIALILAGYWFVVNFSWLIYKFTPHYERQAYGMTWRTDIRKAEEKSLEEHKRMALFFLKKDDPASDGLKKNVLASNDFKIAKHAFVMVLVEEPKPDKKGKIDPRMKSIYDQLIQRHGDADFGTVMMADALRGGGQSVFAKIPYKEQSPKEMLDLMAGGKFTVPTKLDEPPKYQGMGILGVWWDKAFGKDPKAKKVKKVRKVKKPAAAAPKPAPKTEESATVSGDSPDAGAAQ